MSSRVDSSVQKLPSYVRVPIVLYFIVCSPRQSSSYQRPLVTEETVEFDDELVFFFGKVTSFKVGAEVVDPPETAAFAAPEKTGGFGE